MTLMRPFRIRDFHFVALAWLTLQLTGSGPAPLEEEMSA